MVKPQPGMSITKVQRYLDEVKKDHSACYLILLCMVDDIVHLFENIESTKAM